jgi:hypothetical protein
MDAITTIATVPAVLALVNLGKRLGIDGRASLIAAVVLGVAINVANHYLAGEAGYQAAIQGLILGLAAAGVYDITPNTKEQ